MPSVVIAFHRLDGSRVRPRTHAGSVGGPAWVGDVREAPGSDPGVDGVAVSRLSARTTRLREPLAAGAGRAGLAADGAAARPE